MTPAAYRPIIALRGPPLLGATQVRARAQPGPPVPLRTDIAGKNSTFAIARQTIETDRGGDDARPALTGRLDRAEPLARPTSRFEEDHPCDVDLSLRSSRPL